MTQSGPSFLPGPSLTAQMARMNTCRCISSQTINSLDLGWTYSSSRIIYGAAHLFGSYWSHLLLFTELFLKLFLRNSNLKPLADKWHLASWRVELGKTGPCSASPVTIQLYSLPNMWINVWKWPLTLEHSFWHELFLHLKVTKVLNVRLFHSCSLEQSTWVSTGGRGEEVVAEFLHPGRCFLRQRILQLFYVHSQ